MCCLFDRGRHFHFSFEVHFRLLVALLPIFQLLVPAVDQMVAGGDVVVSVVLDALLSVLPVERELVDDLVEQLLFDRHLLLAREEAHVAVAVLDEQGPRMVSNVADSVPLLWICVQNSSDDVLALAREKFGK